MLDLWVPESLCKHLQAQALHHFLHHDFDEDTTATRRVVFVDLYTFQYHPRYSVGRHEMTEEARNVAQAVRLVPVDCGVVVVECLLEGIRPYAIEFAEPLADQAVESRVRTLLRATLDDHVD